MTQNVEIRWAEMAPQGLNTTPIMTDAHVAGKMKDNHRELYIHVRLSAPC